MILALMLAFLTARVLLGTVCQIGCEFLVGCFCRVRYFNDVLSSTSLREKHLATLRHLMASHYSRDTVDEIMSNTEILMQCLMDSSKTRVSDSHQLYPCYSD
jgi:hypothetical protein